MSQDVAHFILQRLADWGVRRIYGYPGDGINGLLGAFHDVGDRVEFLQVRHEEIASFAAKAEAFKDVVKSGRTHLMDATPVTLGQEFGGYAAQVAEAAERIEAALPRVGRLPLGGTAVGTGINAAPGFGTIVDGDMAPRLREAPGNS